jgi:hypothetical protein
VQQHWGFHSLSGTSRETRRTNDEGYVAFPERTVRAPLIGWIVGLPLGILSHGGWGEYAGLYAYGEDPYVWTSENCGIYFPAPTELRLKRWRVSLYPSR